MKTEYESIGGDYWMRKVETEVDKLQKRLDKLGLGAKIVSLTIKYEGKK